MTRDFVDERFAVAVADFVTRDSLAVYRHELPD